LRCFKTQRTSLVTNSDCTVEKYYYSEHSTTTTTTDTTIAVISVIVVVVVVVVVVRAVPKNLPQGGGCLLRLAKPLSDNSQRNRSAKVKVTQCIN